MQILRIYLYMMSLSSRHTSARSPGMAVATRVVAVVALDCQIADQLSCEEPPALAYLYPPLSSESEAIGQRRLLIALAQHTSGLPLP